MDAKPLQFYKGDSIYSALLTDNTFPKIDGTKSKSSDAYIFSYFKKSQPETKQSLEISISGNA